METENWVIKKLNPNKLLISQLPHILKSIPPLPCVWFKFQQYFFTFSNLTFCFSYLSSILSLSLSLSLSREHVQIIKNEAMEKKNAYLKQQIIKKQQKKKGKMAH